MCLGIDLAFPLSQSSRLWEIRSLNCLGKGQQDMSIISLAGYENGAKPALVPVPAIATNTDKAKSDPAAPVETTDIVDISPEAREALAAEQANQAASERHYPDGSGYSSEGKEFDQV